MTRAWRAMIDRKVTHFALPTMLFASPAHASDFTGILTFMTALFGGVFVIVAGTVYGAARTCRNEEARWMMNIFGILCGGGMTAWWILDPIDEGTAFLLLFAPALLCLLISGLITADEPKGDA